MKIITKIVILVLMSMVLAIGGALGVKTYKYMANQKFDFKTAFEWASEDLEKEINTFLGKNNETEPLVIDMHVNEHIDVVACTSL